MTRINVSAIPVKRSAPPVRLSHVEPCEPHQAYTPMMTATPDASFKVVVEPRRWLYELRAASSGSGRCRVALGVA
jgi:hypothetical protein